MNINEIVINAAFYEMFESIFGEDFFSVLAELRESPRIAAFRQKKAEELTTEETDELMEANIKLATMMKRYTPRIAYIGNKLYKKQYSGSYEDYLAFLSTCGAADFLDPEIIAKIWEKITADQNTPKSVKNV